jgi:hypothetical protein
MTTQNPTLHSSVFKTPVHIAAKKLTNCFGELISEPQEVQLFKSFIIHGPISNQQCI